MNFSKFSNKSKKYYVPRDADKIMSGYFGLVAIWVTHPLCPIRVPRRCKVSVIFTFEKCSVHNENVCSLWRTKRKRAHAMAASIWEVSICSRELHSYTHRHESLAPNSPYANCTKPGQFFWYCPIRIPSTWCSYTTAASRLQTSSKGIKIILMHKHCRRIRLNFHQNGLNHQ